MNPDNPDWTEQESSQATLCLRDSKGLHHRPAARIARRLRAFPDARVVLLAAGSIANARSPLSILRLRVRCGDPVKVEAKGSGADEAVQIVREVVEGAPRRPTAVLGELFSGEGSPPPHSATWAKTVKHIDKAEVEDWKNKGGWIYELVNEAALWDKQESVLERGSGYEEEPPSPDFEDAFVTPNF